MAVNVNMKKILASVGTAQLLIRNNGTLEHFADVDTLTESSLNFSNTMDDIRAGEQAQLIGRFAHDAGMTVTLTNAVFDIGWVAKQVGAENIANPSVFHTESLKVTEGKITFGKTPVSLGSSCGLSDIVVWVRALDCDAPDDIRSWTAYVLTKDDGGNAPTQLTLTGDLANQKEVCVRYFVSAAQARGALIRSKFNPAEMVLLLTTKLFAAESSDISTGKPVGHITVKIPRFQLDGNFDLSMAMSSPATQSLTGTVLASRGAGCDDSFVYAEIVEYIEGTDFTSGLKMIAIDNDAAAQGAAPSVWGIYSDNHTSKLEIDGQVAPTKAEDCPALITSAATYTKGVEMKATVYVWDYKGKKAKELCSDAYTLPNSGS